MTPKQCPLKYSNPPDLFKLDCAREKCAWWIARDAVHGRVGCALKILALSMDIFVSEQKRFIMAMEKHR